MFDAWGSYLCLVERVKYLAIEYIPKAYVDVSDVNVVGIEWVK